MSETNAAVRTLSAADRHFIARVGRFLTQVVAPPYVGRAVAAGYDDEEHDEGWRLHRVAAGGERPLQHAFALRDLSQTSNDQTDAALAELDDIENRYFPIVLRVIRRKVPEGNLARFEAAFFDGLSQQPKGPGVISSVDKLINRVDALAQSDEAGATVVHETLYKRGFAKDAERARQLISELRDFRSPEEVIDADEVEKTLRRQHEALDQLRLWFNDWGATLRPHYSLRERIQLGLSRIRRGGGGEEIIEDEDDDVEESG